MKAMILAAGLGTRLKPWTLEHPKALVPVGGVPMLERVILSLKKQGFTEIIINIHHFGEQIIDFVGNKEFGVSIKISDERGKLLDTGGGILHAQQLLTKDNAPFLIHNVDILSNADLAELMQAHCDHSVDATLLVSNRTSSRKLIFDNDLNLKGWHNLSTDEFKPQGLEMSESDVELAFSGIHVMSTRCFELMTAAGFSGSFPIMDFYLSQASKIKLSQIGKTELSQAGNIDISQAGTIGIKGFCCNDLNLIDIGKPDTLTQANRLF